MSEYDEEVPDESEQLDQVQAEDSLVDRNVDDVLDEGYSPPEHWSAAEGYGNTAAEMAQGETIDQRLKQEVPDDNGEAAIANELDAEDWDGEVVGDERAGRLVDPDEGLGEDVDSDLIGSDVGIDGAGASAEEAAVHVIPDDES